MGAMTTTLPPSIPPRLVEHEDPERRAPRSGGLLPAQTLRGAVAGAEAAIGAWLVVVVLALAGYVATAAAPELGTAGWVDAAAVGSAIWLLGHGGEVHAGEVAVTVVPLGVTLLGVGGVATSLRRAHPASLWPVLAAVVVYTAFAGGFTAAAATPGAWRGVLGAPLVAGLGALVALRGRVPSAVSRHLTRVPASVRDGLGAGLRAAALLLALGLAVVVLAVVLGYERVLDVHRSLVPDGVSSVVIVAAQVVLLPTLVVWGAAYLTGPGFVVGSGTSFSPHGIEAGPLPVVPVLGALPEPGSPAGSAGVVLLLGVGVGALAGWWLRRRGERSLPQAGVAVAVAAVTAAVLLAVPAALSSGSVGPGRMAEIGPDALAVGAAVAWQTLLGSALAVLLPHVTTRRALARGRDAAARWWHEVSPGRG